jgi:hypothetical membrane protein
MEDLKYYFNKLLKTQIGPICGLLSVLIGLTSDIIALSFFSGFNFDVNMISILGGEYSPGALLFNLGIILSGIFAFPFFLHINRILKEENISKKLRKVALIIALVSCIVFTLVGVFPSLKYNELFRFLHGLFFLISMIGGVIYLLFYSLLFLKSTSFNRFLSYLGFAVILIFWIFLFTWIPIIEWLMTFAIIAWIMSISIYLLYKRL